MEIGCFVKICLGLTAARWGIHGRSDSSSDPFLVRLELNPSKIRPNSSRKLSLSLEHDQLSPSHHSSTTQFSIPIMNPSIASIHVRIPIKLFLQRLPILLHRTVITKSLDLLDNRASKQPMNLLRILVPLLQQSHIPRLIPLPQLIIPSIDIGLCEFGRVNVELDVFEGRFAVSKEEHWFYPWFVECETKWDVSNVDIYHQFCQTR